MASKPPFSAQGASKVPSQPSDLANYNDLFKRSQFPIFLVDMTDHRILEANVACEMSLSLSPDELIGHSLLDWIKKEDQPRFFKEIRMIHHRYYPHYSEYHWVMKDGSTKIVQTGMSVLSLGDERQVIQIIAKDITREREMEAELKKTLENLEEANMKLQILSTTDELTRLANFRQFMTLLEKENERALRYRRPYTIIYCDLDHFKIYNDQNGHLAGDKLLAQVAHLIAESCRNTDFPCRYGGEEFAVLCPELALENALVVAERIRKAIEGHDFEFGSGQPLGRVTMSFGVASCPEHGLTPREVLRAADQALYESKEAGRNRVTIRFSLNKTFPVTKLPTKRSSG